MRSSRMNVTFDDSDTTKRFVLNLFRKNIDKEGFIVEQSKPKQRVLTQDGEEITLSEFAGILKGSEIFVKSNIASLIKAADLLAH